MATPGQSTFDIAGFDQLEARLSRLSAFAVGPILKKALRAGAQMVADAARRNAPHRTGRLARAIRVRAGRGGKGRLSFLASASSRWFAGDTYYGAFQEFGWRSGKRSGSGITTVFSGRFKGVKRRIATGKARKQMPGEHYMEYAAKEVAPQAVTRIGQEILAGIQKEMSSK